MSSLHNTTLADNLMLVYPQTAESILRALDAAVSERIKHRVDTGDLPDRHAAIFELMRLVDQCGAKYVMDRLVSPEGSAVGDTLAAMQEQFGLEDVTRWLSFVAAGRRDR